MSDNKIDKIRDWLTNNKIFFETIGAITLSIMALLVSLGALSVMVYQAQQVEIENQPEFLFSVETYPSSEVVIIKNDLPLNFPQDYLIIKNNGKAFKNMVIEYAIIGTCLYSSYDENKNVTNIKLIEIPLDKSTYSNIPIDYQGKIKIPQLFANDLRNPSEIFNLIKKSFNKYLEQKGDETYAFTPSRFLSVTYDDIYEKSHTKFYFITDDGISSQITKEDYENRLKDFNFTETPEHRSYLLLIPQLESNATDTSPLNDMIFEPWYKLMKKKFDQT
ncbi:MAG: hypothetical protein Q7U51_14330 [Methanoregula sp.]|nr:hypothetical protein [Methanoregula sp.]